MWVFIIAIVTSNGVDVDMLRFRTQNGCLDAIDMFETHVPHENITDLQVMNFSCIYDPLEDYRPNG